MPRKTSSPKRRSASRSSPYTNQLANEVREAHAGIRNLASKIERENVTKGIPFAGSKTAAALAKAFEEPVDLNEEDLAEELQNDTGDCLNKLAYYEAMTAGNLFKVMQPKLLGAAAAGAAYAHKFYVATGVGAVTELALDERASLMASVGTAMVICKILHGVESKTFYSDSGLEKKLVYVEDIISYIHDTFGDVITLDQSSSDAFERMTRDQRRNHERKLLKDMLTGAKHIGGAGSMAVNDHTNAAAAQTHIFFDEKIKAMVTVDAANVGKLWFSEPIQQLGNVFADANADNVFAHIVVDTLNIIKGSPRVEISSNMKIDPSKNGTVPANGNMSTKGVPLKIATEILALVALHVLTYSITAALDFYFKLAYRADQLTFSTDNNVITHSVFAPGLLAALKMYGISEAAFDDEMAFQINTNAEVKELFRAAHQAYDTTGGNLVGAKTFKSEADTVPSWLVSKEEQLKYEQEFARTKGVVKATAPARNAPNYANIATNIAASAKLASNSNLAKHARSIAGFGRRRRRSSRKASFGRRKRSSKRKASFGRRKRSSKRKASFGRRRRRASTARK
jgi:hypothetical protein